MEDTGSIISPQEFRIRQFADDNMDLFDKYITMRIRGINPVICLRMVFGDAYIADGLGISRVYGLEANSYYIDQFMKRLDEIDFKKLWNPKEAVHLLLTIAHDPSAKDQARLNAITQLNVLSGITMVDGSGNTKATRGLADFYNDIKEGDATGPAAPGALYQVPQDEATKH